MSSLSTLSRYFLARSPVEIPAIPRAPIYRRLVRANLEKVIRNAFPETLALLGEEAFGALVSDFLEAGGPTTPLYREIPGDLARWAGEIEHPLADLLAFEWLELVAARHPAEIDALDPVAPGSVRPNPTMQLAVFMRPVELMGPQQPSPETFASPMAYAVWRRPLTDEVEHLRLGLLIARALAFASLEPAPVDALAQRIADEVDGVAASDVRDALAVAVAELRRMEGVLD